MSDAIVSLIRTYVPVAVGALIAWFLTLGLELDPETEAGLVTGFTGLIIAVYYTLVRLLEQRWPWVGALLGSTRQPQYQGAHAAVADDNGTTLEHEPRH